MKLANWRTVAAAAITALTAATAALVTPVVIAAPAAAAVTPANLPGTGTLLQGSGFSRSGTPATITASVFPANPTAGEPVAKGSVSFFDGGKLLVTEAIFAPTAPLCSVTSNLTPGLHSITAVYSGDANYAAAPRIRSRSRCLRQRTSRVRSRSPAWSVRR